MNDNKIPVFVPDKVFAEQAEKIAEKLGSQVIVGVAGEEDIRQSGTGSKADIRQSSTGSGADRRQSSGTDSGASRRQNGTDDGTEKGQSSMTGSAGSAEENENKLVLYFDAGGLALSGDGMMVRGDFTRMARRLKHGLLERELLVRAARFRHKKGPFRALDATAGMGEDSLLLAAAGFSVDMYEYDPVIALLLEDAVRRAAEVPELAEAAGRMHVFTGDSIAAMKRIAQSGEKPPDVILLDPMFPEKHKNSLTKKKFQLIHRLEKPCSNEEELLDAALSAAPERVIIKRPVKGPYLAGYKPDYSIKGKTVRYDCIAAGIK
jgi:16S rRNA (guanine1516-N2)-methyltransferase